MRTMTDVTGRYEAEDGTQVFEMSEPLNSGETLLKVANGMASLHFPNGRWVEGKVSVNDLKLKPVPEKPKTVQLPDGMEIGVKYKFLGCCGGHWFWVDKNGLHLLNEIDGEYQTGQTIEELWKRHQQYPGETKPVKEPEQTKRSAMDRVLKVRKAQHESLHHDNR